MLMSKTLRERFSEVTVVMVCLLLPNLCFYSSHFMVLHMTYLKWYENILNHFEKII